MKNSFIIIFVFTPSAIKNLCPLKKERKKHQIKIETYKKIQQ